MQGEKQPRPLGIRVPDDLKQWLKHRAVDNRRSLNAEILIRLEASRCLEESAGATAKKKP